MEPKNYRENTRRFQLFFLSYSTFNNGSKWSGHCSGSALFARMWYSSSILPKLSAFQPESLVLFLFLRLSKSSRSGIPFLLFYRCYRRHPVTDFPCGDSASQLSFAAAEYIWDMSRVREVTVDSLRFSSSGKRSIEYKSTKLCFQTNDHMRLYLGNRTRNSSQLAHSYSLLMELPNSASSKMLLVHSESWAFNSDTYLAPRETFLEILCTVSSLYHK